MRKYWPFALGMLFALAVLAWGIWSGASAPKSAAQARAGADETTGAAVDPTELEALASPYKKTTTLLQPCLSAEPLGFDRSKMGGAPNLNGFAQWPVCGACGAPLNFVMQLYQRDFPGFYFPDGMNIFQLFRCPNLNCGQSGSDSADLSMYHFYFNVAADRNKKLAQPRNTGDSFEPPVPDCLFKPMTVADYPNYDDYPERAWAEIEKKLGDADEAFIERYSARIGTKFGGYPSWTQFPAYPICTCGAIKEFLFQLASEEPVLSRASAKGESSPHGIMIGDMGNIYFFICRKCGVKSIETNWDCY